jgi:hypothetical protein
VSQLQFGRGWRRENPLPPPGFDLPSVQPVDIGDTDSGFPAANETRRFEFKYPYLLMHGPYKTDSHITEQILQERFYVLNKKKNRVAQKFLDARGNIFIKFY